MNTIRPWTAERMGGGNHHTFLALQTIQALFLPKPYPYLSESWLSGEKTTELTERLCPSSVCIQTAFVFWLVSMSTIVHLFL